jgi:hypothetical protein
MSNKILNNLVCCQSEETRFPSTLRDAVAPQGDSGNQKMTRDILKIRKTCLIIHGATIVHEYQ